MTGLTPEYLRIPIPSLHGHLFGYRLTNVLKTFICKTDRYQDSFFPDSVILWNLLGPEMRGAESLSILKNKHLRDISSKKKAYLISMIQIVLNGFFNLEWA